MSPETAVAYFSGVRIIQTEVVEEPGSNLDNLIRFLNDHRDEEETEVRVGVLEEIEAEMSSLRSAEESE